jgi:hypothetical protein
MWKGRFVRVLPVHAPCSEKQNILDQPLVHHAANDGGEPKATNTAAGANDRNAGFAAELHFDATGPSSCIKKLIGDEDVVKMKIPNKLSRCFVCTFLV